MTRVAFVTGGTRGIGRAICERLVADGMKVAAGYSGNEEAAAACAKDLGVMVVKGNVGSFDDCAAAVKKVEAELGPIDVLINNAGITRDGMLHKMTYEQWSEVIRVNMDSAFNMTRPVIEGMRERNWGRIINISSINGQKGQMGQTNYSAAKAGMAGFAKALAQEVVKKGVTVNTVSPGYVETDMVMAIRQEIRDQIIAAIPMGRLARPEEVAAVVAFLASDEAGYITGANISVNGGMHMM
jgi:acetoacetyl-CoA reductase